MQEIWKDIPEFEGIYQASTHGRIKGVAGRTTESTRHGTRVWSERIIKPKGTATRQSSGYRVTLYKKKKSYDFLVARLVAATFLGNEIHTKLTVNHKDGNRLNNNIENLEWLSLADNIRHGMQNGLFKSCATTIKDLSGNETVFYSRAACSRFLGVSTTRINYALSRKQEIVASDGNTYTIVSIKKKDDYE
mgnify:CR=1 FL=1